MASTIRNGIDRYKRHRLLPGMELTVINGIACLRKGKITAAKGDNVRIIHPLFFLFLGGDKGSECSFEPLGQNTVEAPSLLRRDFIGSRNKASKACSDKWTVSLTENTTPYSIRLRAVFYFSLG